MSEKFIEVCPEPGTNYYTSNFVAGRSLGRDRPGGVCDSYLGTSCCLWLSRWCVMAGWVSGKELGGFSCQLTDSGQLRHANTLQGLKNASQTRSSYERWTA